MYWLAQGLTRLSIGPDKAKTCCLPIATEFDFSVVQSLMCIVSVLEVVYPIHLHVHVNVSTCKVTGTHACTCVHVHCRIIFYH